MVDMEKLYQDLTGVDLETQKRIWDERGKGYYGEFLVFQELFLNIAGNAKFLMNLNLPVDSKKTTELDLIMIHETGLYIFEVKHYKGTIYGGIDENTWTQYFPTADNHKFNNPVLQNAYHIKSVQALFPNVPIFSVIVFSNEDCKLHIDGKSATTLISPLRSLIYNLSSLFKVRKNDFDIDTIEQLFQKLKPYSAICNATVTNDDSLEIPFLDYLEQLKETLVLKSLDRITRLETAEANYDKMRRKDRKKWWISLVACIVAFALIAGLFTSYYLTIANERVRSAQDALQEMQNNFSRVDSSTRDNTALINSIITVSNLSLTEAPYMENTLLFSCTLTNTDTHYGIMFEENTSYIIHYEDGHVQEYAMFGERLSYGSDISQRLSGTADKMTYKHYGTLEILEIYNVSDVDSIRYIKLKNVSLWKLYENNNKALETGLELELFRK